jgi:plastocyanin
MKIQNLLLIAFILPMLAGATEAPQTVSGCQEQDYVLADQVASIAINGRGYTPRCLKVRVGTQVTISASSHHPLAPQAQALNPIPDSESTVTVEFLEPGTFGYFCVAHGNDQGEGMAGSILVVEEL